MTKKNVETNPFTNETIEESTEVMTVERHDIASVDLINELKNPASSFFCSIPDDGTRKSKVAIYNAVNTQDEQLADHIGEVLEITDVVAHPVKLIDADGVVVEALRTVLVDVNNVKYGAVSAGITSSLQKIFAIVGMPTWKDEPVKMKIKQVKTSNGVNKVNTIELVD